MKRPTTTLALLWLVVVVVCCLRACTAFAHQIDRCEVIDPWYCPFWTFCPRWDSREYLMDFEERRNACEYCGGWWYWPKGRLY